MLYLLEDKKVEQVKSRSGRTPLHEAANRGCDAIIRLLFKHGALLEAEDEQGQSSLTLAAGACHVSTISLLLELGANAAHR